MGFSTGLIEEAIRWKGALINNGVTSGGEIITHALNLSDWRLIHTQDSYVAAAKGPEFLQLGAPTLHDLC